MRSWLYCCCCCVLEETIYWDEKETRLERDGEIEKKEIACESVCAHLFDRLKMLLVCVCVCGYFCKSIYIFIIFISLVHRFSFVAFLSLIRSKQKWVAALAAEEAINIHTYAMCMCPDVNVFVCFKSARLVFRLFFFFCSASVASCCSFSYNFHLAAHCHLHTHAESESPV